MGKETKLIQDTDSFTITLGGNNEIDSEYLGFILQNIAKIIKLSMNEIDNNAFCKLNFKTTRSGSIEIDFSTIVEVTKNLFNYTVSAVGTAYIATEAFKKMIEIKDFLKGKKPKKIIETKSKITITNHDNGILKIDKSKSRADIYFKDPIFENCIINIFNSLEHEQRENFTFKRKNKSDELKIPKEHYSNMRAVLIEKNDLEKTTSDLKKVEIDLTIKKPDLLGNSKWEVIFDKKIDVKISDEQFLTKVRSGKIKLYAGCKIKVKMNINSRFDENLDVIDVDYDVIEVVGDIIEPIKTPDLFDNN